MPFRKPNVPAARRSLSTPEKEPSMSIIGSVGLAVGRALIPDLINRATRGRGETLERVAQGVTSVVLGATGLQADTPADQVLAALEADPAAYARVKEAAASVAIAEIDAEIRAEQLAAQDRASARQMQIQLRSKVPERLAYISAAFAFSALVAVVVLMALKVPMEPSMATLFGGVIAAAIGTFGTALNFFLGSSEGSRAKTDIMSDRLPYDRQG